MATTDRTIRVGTTNVTIRTSNRTTLGITVTQHGNVIVHGPPTTTDADATDLVNRRCSWIYRQLAHLAKTAPHAPLKELVPGTGFDVLGRRHRLRIVPDSNQNEPLIQLRGTPTGSWLHMRHSTSLKTDEARRTLINLYVDSGREWLEVNLPQIAANTIDRNLAATFSTRMRTTWTRHHTSRGLTLHWATAQLHPHLLRELIHRTLNLHTVANTHDLNNALRTLWLGRLTPPENTHPRTHFTSTTSGHCPDCSAPPGTFHADRCDIARCAHTGLQRAHCHPGNTCNTIWTGQIPGQAECTEYGFYCRPAPGGYEPCNADDPDAMHDFNRLYRKCRWDRAAQRMSLRPDT
ncbi:YgjP-like metallopeptidase domain-containing protein [Streptomyces yunnanensis]|uniref:Predicted metal-dependent hydrolase n=1 Tax=Streptomyces yunnanensis TaxID=156453 RepID=A0A9X8QYJ6_9ACTN|nr:YgjP-like metallopeptidase domain-containing protein [Streptomyces yunnanensis]SHN09049.1 Predicted metal-dependent hydrolase [Streptomyces yunnanensis]